MEKNNEIREIRQCCQFCGGVLWTVSRTLARCLAVEEVAGVAISSSLVVTRVLLEPTYDRFCSHRTSGW